MATEKQKAFFEELLRDRQFPAGSPDEETLRSQFAAVPDKSASAWIEKALSLPEKGAVPPAF